MTKRRTNAHADDTLQSDDPILDISSLIDVCFLLLIYFLVTTTIQPREQDLKVGIPGVGEASPWVHTPMLIEVRRGGEVVVNPGDAAEFSESDATNRSLPELQSRLGMFSGMAAANIPRVLLRVHDEVEQQRYIDVVNCLAGAGIRDIALQD